MLQLNRVLWLIIESNRGLVRVVCFAVAMMPNCIRERYAPGRELHLIVFRSGMLAKVLFFQTHFFECPFCASWKLTFRSKLAQAKA
jgi:hypothetical protein